MVFKEWCELEIFISVYIFNIEALIKLIFYLYYYYYYAKRE